jgi:glutathione S-transferase
MFGFVLALLLLGVGWWAWERAHRRTHPMAGGLRADITLPHSQEFELYHNALSLCSKKARICLAELGVPYASHPIDLIETGSYENIGRRFLAVNPAGLVPVLVHDGHPIYESHDQIRYAAEHAPGGVSLIPGDEAGDAEMQSWVDRASLMGEDPLAGMAQSAGNTVPALTVPLFAAMIVEIPVWKILEGLLFHRAKIRPMLFLMLKLTGLRRLHRVGRITGIVRSGIGHMNVHLDALEKQLGSRGGPFILGEPFTLADVSWFVIFDRLQETDSLQLFLGDGLRPATTAYWERLRARPSYREAILEQGHPTITRGTERLRQAKAADPELRAALETGPEARG